MAHSVDEWLGALWQVMPRGKAWSRDEDADLNRFIRPLDMRLSQTEFDAEHLPPDKRPEPTHMHLDA